MKNKLNNIDYVITNDMDTKKVKAYEKYMDLHKRLHDRLNLEYLTSDNELITLKDIYDSLNEELTKYNNILIKNIKKDINKMNKNYHNYYKLYNISFMVHKDGTYDILLYIHNDRNKISNCVVVDKNTVLNGENELYRCNNNYFQNYCDVLDEFVNEYPGVEYKFDGFDHRRFGKNNFGKSNYEFISDGFITLVVDLNDTVHHCLSFTDLSDLVISQEKYTSEGELYDYCCMRENELASKSVVNINDLDEFTKKVVEKHLNLDKQKTLKIN